MSGCLPRTAWPLLLLALAAAPCAAAVVEEVMVVTATVENRYGRPLTLPVTVTVFRDDDRAKAPFLVLNHGRPAQPDQYAKMGRVRFADNARWFVARGFAVFVPTRIGYGVTGGEDMEYGGIGSARQYGPGFEAAAVQTQRVIELARGLPYVDAERGVLAGQSFGGGATLATAARRPPGVVAAINFAGGAGGDPTSRPGEPSRPDLMEKTFAGYGRTTVMPCLWLYSENDRYFGAAYPKQWFEAYRRGNAAATFVALPALPVALGSDGHATFTRNPAAWQPAVEAFLDGLGFGGLKPPP